MNNWLVVCLLLLGSPATAGENPFDKLWDDSPEAAEEKWHETLNAYASLVAEDSARLKTRMEASPKTSHVKSTVNRAGRLAKTTFKVGAVGALGIVSGFGSAAQGYCQAQQSIQARSAQQQFFDDVHAIRLNTDQIRLNQTLRPR